MIRSLRSFGVAFSLMLGLMALTGLRPAAAAQLTDLQAQARSLFGIADVLLAAGNPVTAEDGELGHDAAPTAFKKGFQNR